MVNVVTKQEPIELAIPPAAPPSPQKPKAKPKGSGKNRGEALKAIADHRKAIAWPLHRWPLDKLVVDERTRIQLPRTYRAKDGVDVRVMRAGTDLNRFVHTYYFEEVDLFASPGAGQENTKTDTLTGWPGANYVTPDKCLARRHEYLGPDPRVVGYYFDMDGEVHIKWWDGFLQDQWMDKGTWEFGVRMDEQGEWVEV